MLVEFSFRNYKSFREKQTFTMAAGAEKGQLTNSFSVPALSGKRLVRTAVIYGPNASGKSNFVDAVRFVHDFVTHAAERNPEIPIPTQPFRLDSDHLNKPSEFELTFIHAGIRYQYGFELDQQRVYQEWLLAYPKKTAQTWFERAWNQEASDYEWYFGPFLKGEKLKLTPLTRPNALYLSVAAQFNHEQLSEVYRWFARHVKVIEGASLPSLEAAASALVVSNTDLRDKLRELLSMADVGIADLSIRKSEKSRPRAMQPVGHLIRDRLPSTFSPFVSHIRDEEEYEVSFYHQGHEKDSPAFKIEEESLGTRRLFALGGSLLQALKTGQIVVVDELDSSLHPMIMRTLVELFNDPTANPLNAQLIFNTHDITLLDWGNFRRDQIWFTEKDNDGASQLYSLLEFRPRSTEAFGKGYLHGRYGAVPIVGSLERLVTNGADS
jgi:AAA15 family ATPase/GTPase